MANQPRADNPHRMVRVEDDLWIAAGEATAQLGTTRSEVMREALRELVATSLLTDPASGPGFRRKTR